VSIPGARDGAVGRFTQPTESPRCPAANIRPWPKLESLCARSSQRLRSAGGACRALRRPARRPGSLAGEAAAVGQEAQVLRAGGRLGLLRHVGELVAIVAPVRHLVGGDRRVATKTSTTRRMAAIATGGAHRGQSGDAIWRRRGSYLCDPPREYGGVLLLFPPKPQPNPTSRLGRRQRGVLTR
jgi:hypothetical protein